MTDGISDEKETCVHCRHHGDNMQEWVGNIICENCWEAGKRGRLYTLTIGGLHKEDYELVYHLVDYIIDRKLSDGTATGLFHKTETFGGWSDENK